jgi:hypothetical protein
MKLVMFTPAVKTSAIGRMTRLVVRQLLATQHEVVVVRTESQHVAAKELHDFGCTVLPWENEAEVTSTVKMPIAVCIRSVTVTNSMKAQSPGSRRPLELSACMTSSWGTCFSAGHKTGARKPSEY